ncbi:MAG: aminoacyl-tRNA hydrolase [Deltaproteobacteria bacterium]|nr:aminoacyl-tRNA hydrolase [Deltaproteobacteria bacterium]
MGKTHVWLLVGLGNPGSKYDGTRHNVGFQIVDALAIRGRASSLRAKLGAEVGETRIGSERVLLCKPMEFMNTSGQALVRIAQFWKVDPTHTVVMHDDLDLPFGRLKLAAGGGHGGHNGLRSIIAEWGTSDFARVRFGIGRPASPEHAAADYVLSDFKGAERKDLADLCSRAAEAVESIVTMGLVVAMNKFNGKAGSEKVSGSQ